MAKVFKIGDKVEALVDQPGSAFFVHKGDIVTVIDKDLGGDFSYEFFYTDLMGPTVYTYAGFYSEFDLLPNPPITPNTQMNLPAGAIPFSKNGAVYIIPDEAILNKEREEHLTKYFAKSCECGSSHVGSPLHSTYCPMFEKS